MACIGKEASVYIALYIHCFSFLDYSAILVLYSSVSAPRIILEEKDALYSYFRLVMSVTYWLWKCYQETFCHPLRNVKDRDIIVMCKTNDHKFHSPVVLRQWACSGCRGIGKGGRQGLGICNIFKMEFD